MVDGRSGIDGEHVNDELLSDFAEGGVVDRQARLAIEAHLRVCAVCREQLSELRAIIGLLGNLPEPALPRSFELTPSIVEPRTIPIAPWYLRAQPAFRWATAVAAVVLVLVFGADLLTHQVGNGASNGSQEVVATSGSSALSAGSSSSSTSQSSGSAAGLAANPTSATEQSHTTSGSASSPSTGAEAQSLASSTPAAGGTHGNASSASQPKAVASPEAQPFSAAQATTGPTVHEAKRSATSAAGTSQALPWRIAEVALALLVTWLLFMTAALPRMRRTRR